MGILWFGNVKSIEDFKVNDLRSERLRQEVSQDQLLGRMRRAQDEFDGLLDAASEPGLSISERDVAAYKMEVSSKRKTKAESDLQGVLTRLQVIDSTIDLLDKKSELQKKGIWKKMAELDADELGDQLENLAVERKAGALNVNRIAEVLDVNMTDVASNRSAVMRNNLRLIEEAAKDKLS